jgi:hypothetical protein
VLVDRKWYNKSRKELVRFELQKSCCSLLSWT